MRTLAGGNYPELNLDKDRYVGVRMLDMGCGDGRNLKLLQDLGFEVHAVELSENIIASLRANAIVNDDKVQFRVGRNNDLHYTNGFFNYMLCCSSCYYLEGKMTWRAVREELARVLKPGGLMIADFPDEQNAVLRDAVRYQDGSLTITNDPFNIRNGTRFMAARSIDDLRLLLAPEFRLLASGHRSDNFYGLCVSGFMTVFERV